MSECVSFPLRVSVYESLCVFVSDVELFGHMIYHHSNEYSCGRTY